jgi:hypothetical protein
MNEAEEDAFLSQATDKVKAAYYKRQADQGNACESSHMNEVVIENWYLDDELLTDCF